jgi:hypothetical protein
MTASVGKRPLVHGSIRALQEQIRNSIDRSSDWPERNDYRGYDTFDDLNAKFAWPFAFETNFYRRYSRHRVNKTPTLRLGQATMLSALTGFYKRV